jgi:glycosyltransferase involved in cell wall biosynthesis
MRTAIVAVAPAPYRDRLFAQLAARPNLETRVFFLQPRDSLRNWTEAELRYPAEFVPCLTPESCYRFPVAGAVNPSLVSRLAAFQPDCILQYGHSFWSQFAVMLWAKRRGIPYLLRCDSNLGNRERRRDGGNRRLGTLSSAVLRYFAKRAAGVVSIGTANDQYWDYFGVEPRRRFFAPFAVDNDRFQRDVQLHRQNRTAIRKEFGLRESHRVLLFAGRFVAPKNLERLLRAWQTVDATGATLWLVGSGPLESKLRGMADDRVVYTPFLANNDMAKIYSAADALILPSTFEPWGLVANEAMACGLPLLLSTACGCAPDLIENGENGWSFDPTANNEMCDAVQSFFEAPSDRLEAMGKRSTVIVDKWHYRYAIEGLESAFQSVTAK